jgi:hypothetical protein
MNECVPQRAEAEAAKLYEDFVESFGEGDDDEKSFVKGEAIQPGSSQSMHKSGGPPFRSVPLRRLLSLPSSQRFSGQ